MTANVDAGMTLIETCARLGHIRAPLLLSLSASSDRDLPLRDNNKMLFKVFSITINDSQDMARLEDLVRGLLGGEHSKKCAFMRSKEYIALRLMALYRKESLRAPMAVYSEGMKICLNLDWSVDVYVLEIGIDNDDVAATLGGTNGGVLGKRRDCSDLEPEEI